MKITGKWIIINYVMAKRREAFRRAVLGVIEMLELQHPYISVDVHGKASYGGGQQFSANPMIRRSGCGIIAATDLLLYLNARHLHGSVDFFDGLLETEPIPFPAYTTCISRMNQRYFPMIPYAGINGLMLMDGVRRFLHEQRMPYSARWCFSPGNLWSRTETMLRQDIPVVMSVGPNFPKIWGKRRVRFYIKTGDKSYTPSAGAKQHYFTVTGMDESWLCISSWGRLYYINRRDFEEYIHRHSLSFVSNVLLVERK